MRHLVLTLIAISVAGIAAIAATTAMLNTPMRIGPATGSTAAPAQTGQAPAPAPGSKEIPDAPPPKNAPPPASGPATTTPAEGEATAAKAPPAEGEAPETPDSDPYEGIAPEELPPDLQYDADASVSFPTNT
jgi:hypothetical protein